MAKKVKENNEVSAVRRSKHGGVLTVFFSLLTVFYLYPQSNNIFSENRFLYILLHTTTLVMLLPLNSLNQSSKLF